MPPYSVGLAIKDINTWAVIFCGFIVYIIWGLVFDMTLTAYQKMDFNKVRLDEINDKIDDLKNKLQEANKQLNTNETEKVKCNGKINELNIRLQEKYIIDYNVIFSHMTEFFTGWISQMTVLSCTDTQKAEAEIIFKKIIEGIKNHIEYEKYNQKNN